MQLQLQLHPSSRGCPAWSNADEATRMPRHISNTHAHIVGSGGLQLQWGLAVGPLTLWEWAEGSRCDLAIWRSMAL